jgi:uracil phosphoribosyltransferase
MSVSYMTHPLIRHKITLLRKESTSTNEFRKLVEEIAMLMGYEALSDLETQEINIKTPLEESKQPVISGKKLAVVPILRAGLGMVNGILALVPSARVGHIGLYRDPVTHEPHEYYCFDFKFSVYLLFGFPLGIKMSPFVSSNFGIFILYRIV